MWKNVSSNYFNSQNNSLWSCEALGQDTFNSKVPCLKFLGKGSIREATPASTHLSQPKPFRQFPALYHTKKLKRTWGFFSSRWDLSLFHTAHQVKLHPNVRNRNLKAILFPGKNGVAQTVVIWPDCTLTCPPEHRVSLVFKAAAEWPRFQTWAAWATADGKEGTVRQAGTSCFPAIHSNKMRCGAMTWQL